MQRVKHNGTHSYTNQHGFFLIEIVIAVTVIAVVLIFLVSSIQDSVEVSQRSLERTQAAYLLEEGMEAVKSIRNQSSGWTTIAALSDGTTYYLHWSGSAWALTTTPETIDSFTRTVEVSEVTRDSDDHITQSGTVDTGTKKFDVTVTWQTPSGDKTETLSFYISNIHI